MKEAKREIIIAGNWKMHKTNLQALDYLRHLIPAIGGEGKVTVFLAVPFTAIAPVVEAARNSGITIGSQNMHEAKEGAYTGEISGEMLKCVGAQFVILGHSERRTIFGEGNRRINHKLKRAFDSGLRPILCIGETWHERENGVAKEILEDQIRQGLEGIEESFIKQLILAYEPVWAIGTGQTATPDTAQEMHSFCRNELIKFCNPDTAEQIPILYGGSVQPENIRALMEKPDIDGALVGGASLSAELFSRIVNYQTINV